MTLTDTQKSTIKQIVNCFETGCPRGNYAAIAMFNDGPHHIKQITYGRSQTTEYGSLKELISRYSQAHGKYSDQLSKYVDTIGVEPLTEDPEFIGLLKAAGKNDPVMQESQDVFFDQRFLLPALKWAGDHGFTLALSAAVIYDSFIHSGSIMTSIRNMFSEKIPKDGGDEKKWITAYVNARDKWLETHENPAVQKTTYRTRTFIQEINKGNWDLNPPIPIKNGSVVL
jgi:chitosanase